MAYRLIPELPEKLSSPGGVMPFSDRPRFSVSDDDAPDDAPDLPTDEPQPAPVQDPPAEPDPTPYVVGPVTVGPFPARERNERF